ncbi:hypothetical protein F4818DRAFT_356449 [Hypoxylon cercidicola]|nr:hypothetical protein F4818DRAFT_356449 [Hypoxylon cercidicola]
MPSSLSKRWRPHLSPAHSSAPTTPTTGEGGIVPNPTRPSSALPLAVEPHANYSDDDEFVVVSLPQELLHHLDPDDDSNNNGFVVVSHPRQEPPHHHNLNTGDPDPSGHICEHGGVAARKKAKRLRGLVDASSSDSGQTSPITGGASVRLTYRDLVDATSSDRSAAQATATGPVTVPAQSPERVGRAQGNDSTTSVGAGPVGDKHPSRDLVATSPHNNGSAAQADAAAPAPATFASPEHVGAVPLPLLGGGSLVPHLYRGQVDAKPKTTSAGVEASHASPSTGGALVFRDLVDATLTVKGGGTRAPGTTPATLSLPDRTGPSGGTGVGLACRGTDTVGTRPDNGSLRPPGPAVLKPPLPRCSQWRPLYAARGPRGPASGMGYTPPARLRGLVDAKLLRIQGGGGRGATAAAAGATPPRRARDGAPTHAPLRTGVGAGPAKETKPTGASAEANTHRTEGPAGRLAGGRPSPSPSPSQENQTLRGSGASVCEAITPPTGLRDPVDAPFSNAAAAAKTDEMQYPSVPAGWVEAGWTINTPLSPRGAAADASPSLTRPPRRVHPLFMARWGDDPNWGLRGMP